MNNLKFSMEITPMSDLRVPPKLKDIYVVFKPNGAYIEILKKCEELAAHGYNPIPHFPARAIRSSLDLRNYVNGARDTGVKQILIIGGDSSSPLGPYSSSMELIETGLFEGFRLGIAGHPEGSPNIDQDIVRQSLNEKAHYSHYIVTQWVHGVENVRRFVEQAPLPVHVGLAGPATISTLIKFVNFIGAKNSFGYIRKYMSNVIDLLSIQTPDIMIDELKTTTRNFHIYTFGGMERVNEWLTINNYL